jgi:hypothetical protein
LESKKSKNGDGDNSNRKRSNWKARKARMVMATIPIENDRIGKLEKQEW